MDTLRGFGTEREHDLSAYDAFEDSIDERGHAELPPPAIGQDERRMQVRAYNFWAGLLGQGQYPSVETLLDGQFPDFADHSVLLHFDAGIEDPAIAYLGSALASECETSSGLNRLSDVPGRSLLSRITDHYLQIIANQAPIGFEAEFVNQRGRTILYRGILLPFSSDNAAIDYIYGVINWKELADQKTTDALLLEIDKSLGRIDQGQLSQRRLPAIALSSWADGPANHSPTPDLAELDLAELDLAEIGAEILEPAMDAGFPLESTLMPDPEFGSFQGEPESLADWLASARDLAVLAHSSEDRTRGALYEAIGRAWDFALAAAQAPDDYAEMIADAGLTMQERAPLTPLVKLVFGAGYDKTRITEYAAVLGHAQRLGLPQAALGRFLADAPGGLKGVVSAERRLRREESGKTGRPATIPLEDALRALAPRSLAAIDEGTEEFALVMVRRLEGGGLALLGEIARKDPLFERAARRLID
jgi:hypothetical protein